MKGKQECITKRSIELFLITLLLEVTIFNFRYWESLTFKSQTDFNFYMTKGIQKTEEGYYKIIDSENAYIDIVDFQANIKNLYLNIIPIDGVCTQIEITADDAANSFGFYLGETVLVSSVKSSQYVRLHLNGMTNYIRVKIKQPNDFLFYLEQIGLNKVRPFEFSWLRIIMVFACIVFFWLFGSKFRVYSSNLILDKKWKKVGLICYVAVHIIIIILLSQLINPDKTLQASIDRNGWPAYGQYNELADALIKGQVYLDREPPKSLEMASNPYDGGLRWKAVVEEGREMFDYDYAYFNGKYYSYFGPVPAFLFFIPYKLITGTHVKTWDVVTFCTILFCIAGFWFIYELGKQYFSSLSFGMYLLMSSFYIFGSGIVYLVYLGIVYSVPIITSLLFGTIGLACWVTAKSSVYLRKKFLLIGACFIALIIGCRPQMAIICLLAFPIFWDEIIYKRLFFSKKGMGNTLCVIIPFIFVGFLIMYYNYVRFQSPFDFGANYNLTSNDMTHRGIVLDRVFLGSFVYLFQPLNIIPKYPFMQTVNVANDYLGFTYAEPLFGGYFILNILGGFSLMIFRFKKLLKENHIYGLVILSFLFSIIIMIADIQMAGLTQRYMSDFGWLITISAIVQSFLLEKLSLKYNAESILRRIVQILMFLSIFLNLWNVLIVDRYFSLIYIRPTLFYMIKHSLFFE